jgi:membrane glycosyltransferase
MILRRLVLIGIAALIGAGLVALLTPVLAAGGWTVPKALTLLCFLGVVPWLGLAAGNGLIGFAVLMLSRRPALAVLPVHAEPDAGPVTLRIALALTVRHEDMRLVLPPLRRLLDGLDAAGAGDRVGAFILSDSHEPASVATEEEAVAAFRAADPAPARLRYRRRTTNEGFKAGNIMDFLDHHAEGFDVAVPLDADSAMTAAAVLRLVRILQAGPRLALVQHLTVGLPAERAFPRLFQFGMRAGMRVWATGQAWWQRAEGPYWGHNAAFRIAPFRDHCKLAPLPDGRPILSHDQVEAARLCAAGWGVCVFAEEDGSAEINPPALPEFLRRDARWAAGNLQYRHLIARPGWRAMGRWQLVQAILLFAGAPIYLAMFALTALSVATGGGAATPPLALAALALAWLATLYLPKLLGYAEVLLKPPERARYGGAARFAAGAGAELLFTLLLDPPAQVSKTFAMLRALAGRQPPWGAQNRSSRGVTWREAAAAFWPHTLTGLVCFALLAAGSWGAALWALPFAGGLLTVIPFAVLTADARLSARFARRGIAAVPEEIVPLPDLITRTVAA